MQDKIKQLLSEIQACKHKALARAITVVENSLDGYKDILVNLHSEHQPKVIGITGPPGAGKSTLVNALIQYFINEGNKVAVLAVDPSSPFNYGSILGDRIRMSDFYNNDNVYIRSLASRGALGGLNPKIIEITDVLKAAPFDYIFIETVGVGQSEVEIAGLADCSVVTLVPEAGDEVQTLKAGIMEIADIFVVNKADRAAADALYNSLRIMVHEKANDENEIPVVKTIATKHEGLDKLSLAIDNFFSDLHSNSTRRTHLLTEKCWQLIQSSKMEHLDKSELFKDIEKESAKEGFNLYAYTNKYL